MDNKKRGFGSFFVFFALGLLASWVLYTYRTNLFKAPCEEPIRYRIGQFDPRFKIPSSELQKAINKAIKLWSEPIGKDLFTYGSTGRSVTVNLIYDERQENTHTSNELVQNINNAKKLASLAKEKMMQAKSEYTARSSEYETALKKFQRDQENYNAEVDRVNNNGGATPDEYEKLNEQKAVLTAEYNAVEKLREGINSLAEQINALTQNYNSLAMNINKEVDNVNRTYGEKFNEGEYISDITGESINIYEFSSEKKLERVIAHELGHALGLDHNDDPESIMYELNSGPDLVLTKEDIASLQAICKKADE